MKIKLCGISDRTQFTAMDLADVDMLGFNFYPKSKRYIDPEANLEWMNKIPLDITRVGVFVNYPLDKIQSVVTNFELDYIQLHGDESLEYCEQAKQYSKVIKVFRVADKSDLNGISDFEEVADLFLFDTKTEDEYGGSGEKFNWELLNQINCKKPFLLAGGIGPNDAHSCKTLIDLENFFGLDINSKFEITPGEKNMKWVSDFIQELNIRNHEFTK